MPVLPPQSSTTSTTTSFFPPLSVSLNHGAQSKHDTVEDWTPSFDYNDDTQYISKSTSTSSKNAQIFIRKV